MKKICYITTISLTLEMFVLESAKYIHENTDWDITFVCDYNDSFANLLPDYIHYYPIKMQRGIRLSGIKAFFEMNKFFKEQQFDLIQYSTPNASFYASLAGKLAKIPVRLYCQWGIAYVGFSGLKKSIFKLIEKKVCKHSTCIEPDSKSNLLFSHAEGLYPESVGSVIWNGSACGVNFNKFDFSKKAEYRNYIRNQLGIEDSAFVFGYIGRITRDKGVNELLEASKEVLQNNKVYLLMVGQEEQDNTINKELLLWSKKAAQVKYVGFTHQVEKYLSAMDCYVLPSYREGFGMTVIEAEAMGVPVIITNIRGPIDGIKKDITGLVIEKKDVMGLKVAMKRMLDNKQEALMMGVCGIEFVKNSFDQSIMFQEILNDRRKLLEEKNR